MIGLVSIRADLTYQQGLKRMWSRRTRYDHYFPAFAMLGEQAVLNKEIYCTGIPEADEGVFGYQERWAEYRYNPSMITGLFRSTDAQPLDAWHLSQYFATPPALNESFIQENPPMDRVLAVSGAAAGQHFIFDSFSIFALLGLCRCILFGPHRPFLRGSYVYYCCCYCCWCRASFCS